MKEDIKKCFFCDFIIIPPDVLSTTESVKDYFKRMKIPFTINYQRSKSKIGQKIICLSCEKDVVKILLNQSNCTCESCKE